MTNEEHEKLYREWVASDEKAITPVVTANRAEDEPWRLDRVRRMAFTANAMTLLTYRRPFPPSVIVGMHDHKGELTVTVSHQDWVPFVEPVVALAWLSENETQYRVIVAGTE